MSLPYLLGSGPAIAVSLSATAEFPFSKTSNRAKLSAKVNTTVTMIPTMALHLNVYDFADQQDTDSHQAKAAPYKLAPCGIINQGVCIARIEEIHQPENEGMAADPESNPSVALVRCRFSAALIIGSVRE